MTASAILSGPLLSLLFDKLKKEWLNKITKHLPFNITCLSHKNIPFTHCFCEINLFGSFEIKCNILQVLLIKSPTEATKKGFLDFTRQKISSLQSCSLIWFNSNPHAHHPSLFVIFRCWMGCIKRKCSNRGWLHFYHEAITFLRKAQAPIWVFGPRGVVFFW